MPSLSGQRPVSACTRATTPWWRVVRAGGLLPPAHEVRAAELLRAEGVAVIRGATSPRVDLDRYRWISNGMTGA